MLYVWFELRSRRGRGFHVQCCERIETLPRKLGAPNASWGLIGRGMREVGPFAGAGMDDAPSSSCSAVGGPC